MLVSPYPLYHSVPIHRYMAHDALAVYPWMARLTSFMVQARYILRIVDVVSRLAAPHMAYGIEDSFLIGVKYIFFESRDHAVAVAVGHKYILRLPKSFQPPGLNSPGLYRIAITQNRYDRCTRITRTSQVPNCNAFDLIVYRNYSRSPQPNNHAPKSWYHCKQRLVHFTPFC